MTSAENHLSPKNSHRAPTAAGRAARSRAGALIGLAAVLGLALAGCGPSNGGGTTTGSGSTTAASASTTAGDTPSSVESGAPTSAAPSSAAPATSAAPALCTAASLSGSLDDTGGGAAGHIYMKLILANKSGTTCILDGYPGVSLVKAGATSPIGAPATRDATRPSTGPISLAPGKSAAAVLNYTQAGNYPNCKQVQADQVMVYPPSAKDRLFVAHPLTACSNADIKLLQIGAFQP
ncbi:hypothetical protein CVV68_01105 [Arthrobacter livingstonensis]|uniref:DUF4232 domain-containing protein n=1 Tax=Arthrobacter livingstonensis TaxID=670078 RepID=A0A2V5LE19_9MICC|nr:DUF4232 domain-containing protein [Arthrobacter livingstonensis]PYI69738.1 hypothetical protein CVV68_01105 [Arthrobacter livingstonensis]